MMGACGKVSTETGVHREAALTRFERCFVNLKMNEADLREIAPRF